MRKTKLWTLNTFLNMYAYLWWISACLAASQISSIPASNLPYPMFIPIVSLKRVVSCGTTPIAFRRDSWVTNLTREKIFLRNDSFHFPPQINCTGPKILILTDGRFKEVSQGHFTLCFGCQRTLRPLLGRRTGKEVSSESSETKREEMLIQKKSSPFHLLR